MHAWTLSYIHTYVTYTYIHTSHTYIRYIYIHTYVTYVHTLHIHTYAQTYIHTYIHTQIHTFIDTYIHTHTYVRTCIHTCIQTYIYIHTYIHIYIYISKYVKTYLHTLLVFKCSFLSCLYGHTIAHICTRAHDIQYYINKLTCPHYEINIPWPWPWLWWLFDSGKRTFLSSVIYTHVRTTYSITSTNSHAHTMTIWQREAHVPLQCPSTSCCKLIETLYWACILYMCLPVCWCVCMLIASYTYKDAQIIQIINHVHAYILICIHTQQERYLRKHSVCVSVLCLDVAVCW